MVGVAIILAPCDISLKYMYHLEIGLLSTITYTYLHTCLLIYSEDGLTRGDNYKFTTDPNS